MKHRRDGLMSLPPVFAPMGPATAIFFQMLRPGSVLLGSPNPGLFLLLALVLQFIDALLHAVKGVLQILCLAF